MSSGVLKSFGIYGTGGNVSAAAPGIRCLIFWGTSMLVWGVESVGVRRMRIGD